jgi:hypothetical protein
MSMVSFSEPVYRYFPVPGTAKYKILLPIIDALLQR